MTAEQMNSDHSRGPSTDVLDLNALDIEDIAVAFADQTDYDHRCLIDRRTAHLVIWTNDTAHHSQGSARV